MTNSNDRIYEPRSDAALFGGHQFPKKKEPAGSETEIIFRAKKWVAENTDSEASQLIDALVSVLESSGFEYAVDDVGKHPEGPVWAYAGEKRPINLEPIIQSPKRLRYWYGVDKVYRRCSRIKWELLPDDEQPVKEKED